MSSIKQLRERTGAPIKSVKEALEASEGDSDKAVEYLRKLGTSLANKRASRTANDGLISIALSADRKHGSIIELSSETDFVARTPQFVNIANSIAQNALHLSSSKTENAIDVEELLTIDDSKTKIDEGIIALGEKIEIKRGIILSCSDEGGMLYNYMHRSVGDVADNCGKIGVLLKLNQQQPTEYDIGLRIAMHIAAAQPKYLDVESIPSDHVQKERDILMEAAVVENEKMGKEVPPNVLQRIVDGRLNKWYNDVVLAKQEMLVESDQYNGKARSVEKSVAADPSSASIAQFVRCAVGEEHEVSEGVGELASNNTQPI